MTTESTTREEWRFPLLTRLTNWLIGFGSAALLIFAVLYGCYWYQRPAFVEATKPAIAVVMPPATVLMSTKRSASIKRATKTIAPEAISIPATPDVRIPTSTPEKPAKPETQFDRDLINFERQIP